MTAATLAPPASPNVPAPVAQERPVPTVRRRPASAAGAVAGLGNEAPRRLRISVEMFEEMTRRGLFDDHPHVQLLDGELIDMAAAEAPHESHVTLAAEALRHLIPSGWSIREEKGVTLASSVPQPDVSILNKTVKFFLTRKPRPDEVLLTVEVSDSSLSEDRGRKARIYAAAGLSPYWIVNLVEGTLEVRTDPHVEPDGTATYRTLDTYSPGETVAFTLGGRAFSLNVSDLLPEPGNETEAE